MKKDKNNPKTVCLGVVIICASFRGRLRDSKVVYGIAFSFKPFFVCVHIFVFRFRRGVDDFLFASANDSARYGKNDRYGYERNPHFYRDGHDGVGCVGNGKEQEYCRDAQRDKGNNELD